MLWIFVGVVGWVLSILFVLVLMQMAGQQQDRAARRAARKETIAFADEAAEAPTGNRSFSRGATLTRPLPEIGQQHGGHLQTTTKVASIAEYESKDSVLERALDEIEAIVPPQKLDDMATILLRFIGELTPTEFMEIRSIVLVTCALNEAQRRPAQHQR